MPIELAVVMPVHNEQSAIEGVLRSWLEALAGLGVGFRILVLDDGSTDRTPAVLDAFRSDGRVDVAAHENVGHGPTILKGYRRAADLAEWAFQCDSDGEIPAECFAGLWNLRHGADAVLGVRTDRRQRPARRLVSLGARGAVRLLFGARSLDPNCPFRLVRAGVLKAVVWRIPDDCFAPNIILSGVLLSGSFRVQTLPVEAGPRRGGSTSLAGLRAMRSAAKAFAQTVAWRCAFAGEATAEASLHRAQGERGR